MSERLVPYSCPYCASEDLRPHGETHGEWECRSCLRAFRLAFIGHLARTTTTATTNTTESPGRRDAS